MDWRSKRWKRSSFSSCDLPHVDLTFSPTVKIPIGHPLWWAVWEITTYLSISSFAQPYIIKKYTCVARLILTITTEIGVILQYKSKFILVSIWVKSESQANYGSKAEIFTCVRSKRKYSNCQFHLLLSLLLCSLICPMLQKLFSQANVIGHHVWPYVTGGTKCDQL